MLLLLAWPAVIALSGFYCIRTSLSHVAFTNICRSSNLRGGLSSRSACSTIVLALTFSLMASSLLVVSTGFIASSPITNRCKRNVHFVLKAELPHAFSTCVYCMRFRNNHVSLHRHKWTNVSTLKTQRNVENACVKGMCKHIKNDLSDFVYNLYWLNVVRLQIWTLSLIATLIHS